MAVRLNITMDEDIYTRLKQEVPPKKISAFISSAVRTKLHPDTKTLKDGPSEEAAPSRRRLLGGVGSDDRIRHQEDQACSDRVKQLL